MDDHKEANTKYYILDDSSSIKCPEEEIYRDREWVSSCLGLLGEGSLGAAGNNY